MSDWQKRVWRDDQIVETENGLGGIVRAPNTVYKNREGGIGNAFCLYATRFIMTTSSVPLIVTNKQSENKNIAPEVKDRDTKERTTSEYILMSQPVRLNL